MNIEEMIDYNKDIKVDLSARVIQSITDYSVSQSQTRNTFGYKWSREDTYGGCIQKILLEIG